MSYNLSRPCKSHVRSFTILDLQDVNHTTILFYICKTFNYRADLGIGLYTLLIDMSSKSWLTKISVDFFSTMCLTDLATMTWIFKSS